MKATKLYLILLLIISLLVGGCVSPAQRQAATISRGVYAIQKAEKAGRIDLVEKYANELTRVVPPPKKAIDIKPVEIKQKDGTSNQYIVLPADYVNKPALTIGSPDLTKLEQVHPEVSKQLEADAKNVDKYSKQVDSTVRAIDKAAEKPHSFFGNIFGWIGKFGFFGGIGIIIILAVVAFLDPAIIPLIISVVTRVFSSFVGILQNLTNGLVGLFKKKSGQ